MKESAQPKRTTNPTEIEVVQTVRLRPHERAHLEKLQAVARKEHDRRVPFNEIMVRGLMGLKKV